MRPLDLGGLFTLANDGADVTGLIELDVDGVPTGFERTPVGGERLRDPDFRVVKIVEITAEAGRVGLDEDCGASREVRIEGSVLGEQAGQGRLIVG